MPTDKEAEIYTNPHAPSAQPINIQTSSKSDKGRPAILNQPTNENNVYGTVGAIHNNNNNYSHVTNIIQADFVKEMVRSTEANRTIRELIRFQESIRLEISTRKQSYPMINE